MTAEKAWEKYWRIEHEFDPLPYDIFMAGFAAAQKEFEIQEVRRAGGVRERLLEKGDFIEHCEGCKCQ